jgi:seryl-tRNA synthetase
MAEERGMLGQYSAVLKDVISALRDSVLFLLFLLLLFTPTTIKDRLVTAGFTKGSIAGFDWTAELQISAEQTKTVGQAVSQADENYKELIERLSELEKKVKEPALKESLEKIGAEAQASRHELIAADQAVKRSLSTQQQIVEQVSPSTVSSSGWLYLGKVTEDKKEWASGSSQTVSAPTPLLVPGTKLKIRDDVYLRADGPSNARSSAPILAVLKTGEMVEVLELDYSHAKSGGWFIWARVRRTS